MPIDNTKLKQLYDTLKQGGYKKDYNNFRTKFLGNENYPYRQKVYNLISQNGEDYGSTYGEFMQRMQVAKPTAAASAAPKQPQQIDTLSTIQSARDTIFNPKAAVQPGGKVAQQAVKDEQTQDDAATKPFDVNQANAFVENMRLQNEAAQRQHQNVNGYLQQTAGQFGKNATRLGFKGQSNLGLPLAPKNQDGAFIDALGREYENETEARLAQTGAQHAREALTEANMQHNDPKNYLLEQKARIEKELNARSSQLEGATDRVPSFATGVAGNAMTQAAARLTDKLQDTKYKALTMQLDKVNQALDTLDEAEHAKASDQWIADSSNWIERAGKGVLSFGSATGRSFKRQASKLSNWDFGFSDLAGGLAIFDAVDKADKGGVEALSPEQRKMLDLYAYNNHIQGENKEHLGWGNTAGTVTAQALPFMLEMALNPASGVGKFAQRKAMQWAIKKYGKEKLKQIAKRYLLAKAGTRIAGDWLGAATMSATTGQARVAADAVQRRIGEVETDIDNFGRVTYGGHKNGVDWGEAFGKAFLSNTIENQTEMAGDYFGIIGKAFSKGGQKALDKIGLGFVNDFMRNVSSTKVAKAVTDFENATHWNGTTGEYLEEVLGNVENALMVGDSTFDTDKDTGVFNVDKNIETFLSVAVMGGFFSAVKTASYTAPKKRALNEMADIGRQIDGMLGNNNAALEQWGTWRNTFINGTDEEKKQTLREVMDNQQLPMGFRMAFLEYTKAAQKYHGIAQAEQKRAEEGTLDPIGQALDQAYEEGYGTTEPTERQMAYRRLNETRAKVAQLLELEEGEDLDEAMGNDPIGYIHTLQEQGFTPEQIQPVMDYANAQATYEGVMQQREDSANEQADAVKREVRQITHRQTGQIQKATLDGGEREVYVLNGKVVLYPDGTGVDKQESDDVLYVQDVQTGELFTIAPNRISELAEPTDPQAVIAEREEAIAAATNQEIEQEEGAASGTVAPEPTTVPEMAGVDAQQGGVSATQQQQTAPTYESGSRFTLDLPNGSAVNGVVLQVTPDGVEVQTSSPVNGRFVQVFPTDEFDGMLSSVRDEADNELWSRGGAEPVEAEEENQNDAAANGQQIETKNEKPTLSDVIATLYEKGKEYATILFNRSFFDVAQTPQFMKDLGIRGSKFTIRYGVISRHWGKDNEHTLPREVWEKLPKAIQHPFAITKYYSDNEKKKQKGYRVYTSLQLSNGSFVVVSVEVKNAGRNIEVNAINTIFGRERISDVHDELIYTSETITPEQMALLDENNPHQYPSERESSESKDTSSSRTLQENEGETAANGQQREMQGNGIPVDAKTGEPVYEAVAPDVAWDAIVQEAEGDEAMAMQVVTDMVADMEAKVQKAKKAKVRAGSTVREKLEAQKKHKRRIEEAEAQLEAWRRIAAVKAERIAAAERAKIEAAQQREVTQDDETEVPDFVFDKPENARERGYRMQNGQRADRQEPIAAAVGKEVSVKFTNKVSQPVRVAVVDARSLQPSHQNGQPNVLHFLPEAQPKKRTDHESVHAAEQMAAQMNPEEITSSVTAYTGAPSVNARGEVIQGNNRTAALKRMWQGYPEQAAAYKQYLMDHASEYGLNPEDIAAMEQPVLVNLMDVTDEQAIELGQYDVKDTESGGTERIKPRNVSQKMGDKAERFASILLRTTDEDASVSQLIDEHAVETLKWLEAQHYISPTQYRSAFNAEGEVTTEAKNDLRGILYQAVFKNGSERLEDMFNALPAKAQRAILATAYRDFATPESEKMLPEIQNSIVAFYGLSQDAAFANAKNFEEARKATMAWLQQMQFDFSTGQSVSREGKYTNFALTLAAMYKVQTQTAIQQTFNEMFDLLQGRQQPDLLFNPNPNNTPRTLAEAIREVLNIEYDGTNGSHALGGNNETRTTGRQGSARDDSAGGTDAQGNEAADAEGGTGRDKGRVGTENEGRGNKEKENDETEVIGSSMTADEALDFIADMELGAEIAPEIDLTIENWDALFGKEGIVSTPIGNVKMGENQFTKLMRQGRNGKLGMIKPTLEHPHAIIADVSEAKEGDTTERASSYVFIRSFKKVDGSRYYYFTSITVSKDGKEVVISNQEKRRNAIANLLTKGKLVWKHADDVSDASDMAQGLYSSQGNVSDLATEGTDAPQTTISSTGKDTPENRAVQTSGQENAETSLQSEVTRAEQQTNAEPTEGQKEAGNYKKGRVKVGPFDVVIEQPRGSVRSGVDANGKAWETTMQNTYGYFGGTKGVDGDAIDVFLGNDLDGWDGTTVFVVDQYNPDGSFDEHKVMLGFNSQEEAEAAYFANYESDWAKTHRTEVTAVPLADFTEWVKSSKRKTKAFAEYKVAKRNAEIDAHNEQNEQLAEQLFSMAKEAETEKDFFDRAASLFEVTGYQSDLRDIYNGVKSGEIANVRALSFYTNATLKPVKAGVKVKAPKSEQKQKAEASRQSGYERKHWHADSSLEEMLAREKYLQNAMSFGTKEMAEVFPMAEEWQRDREELKAKYGDDLKNALPNDVKKAFLKKHRNTFANQTALNDELYELRSAIISHKEKAASRAEAAAKEQKAEEENKRFGDFLNGKTPLRRASIVKALTRVSNFGKEGSMTMAQFIEKHVAEGTLELRTKEVDKLQGPSRRQLNRMDASQQAQAENRVKQAGKKTEYLINGFVANKTAYEYAEHLLATKKGKAGEKPRKHAAQPGAPAVSTQEATLRDALVDVAQQSGLEVVVDEKAQQALDEVNGRARTMAFGEEYDYDRYPEGRVEPNIADKYVHIERAKLDHGFANFNEAKEWAKSHIVRTLDNAESGGKGNVKISSTAVNKYLSESAVAKSDSKDVHLAVLKKLPEIIHDSVDVETTPDFKKDENGVRKVGNEINKNVLIHRCYGAVEINGNIYRVKITLKEYKDAVRDNKAYSYEATKIELLAGTLVGRDISSNPGTNNSISVAKLLKDVEMSYRPGVKVLEESAKQRARLREHRYFRTPSGEAYGFTVDGKIYLDPRIATAETPIHEYAHLWADMIRNVNAEAWNDIVGLMKATPIWEEVRGLYPELKTDDEIADEVLAHYSGRRGAERLREAQQQAATDTGKSVFERAAAVAAIQRVKQALAKFWQSVAELFHIRFTSAEEVADRVLADMLNGVNPNKVRNSSSVNVAEFAAKHHLNQNDIKKYADSMRSGSLGGASYAFKSIKRSVLLANEGLSLGQFAKVFKPIKNELFSNFGNVEELREEHVQEALNNRNVMEAARKREEAEKEAERKRLEVFEQMSDEALDKAYMEAVRNNDEQRMRDLVNEAARRNGYQSTDEFRMSHRAPSYDEDGTDKSLIDVANNKDNIRDSLEEQFRMNHDRNREESVAAISQAIQEIEQGKNPTVTIYRAVPKSLKEGSVRNGDWVTLSEAYAKQHGRHALNGDYRIMKENVPAANLYWDGNDINEWGYDDKRDYKYKDTRNNRKLNDLIVRDDKGAIIPLSKRFNTRKKDVRFQFVGQQGAAALDKAEEATTRLDNLGVAREMESQQKDAKAIKLATGWERGGDGKWRYEIVDGEFDRNGELHPERRALSSEEQQELEEASVDLQHAFQKGISINENEMDMVELYVLGGMERSRAERLSYLEDKKYELSRLPKHLDDYLDNEELYQAYPELRNVRIVEGNRNMVLKGSFGFYDQQDKSITLYSVNQETLVHEVQHAIQYIEGFAEGGSPNFLSARRIKNIFNEVTEQIKQLRAEGKDAEADALIKKNRGLYNAYMNHRGEAFRNYKALGGEVEARNVQKRLHMTPEERRQSLAEETEDVAREDQIFIMENVGKADSLGDSASFDEHQNEDLKAVNERFNEQLDEFVLDNADKINFDLGTPSEKLLLAGVADRPIRLHGSKVAKKMKKHGFAIEELRDLPRAVANPIAVFDNLGREGNRSVLTELRTVNGNFLVTIDLGKGTEADFDIVSSVFGKRRDSVAGWINKGYMRYVDKEKALNYLHLSAPIAEASDKAELSSATKVVKDFVNPQLSEENKFRQGASATTSSRPTVANLQAHAAKIVERLHLTNVEIVTDALQLEGKQRTAKGFYNKRTEKITIVLPNHASTADVEQTLLHEAVAHYGLRQLFGEHFDDFLDMVYRNAEEGIRRKIAEASAKHGWNVRTATEEYLADLAERTDFEHASPQWWAKIKGFFLDMLRGLGFEAMDGQTLTDNELRYVLWRSYENLTEPGKYPTFIAEARDVAKQHALQVGRFAPTETAGSRVAENEALSEEETAEILFRDGNDYQYTQALARDRYERRIKSGMYQTQEALQDSMLGLRTAMESILEAEGRKGVYIEDIDGFENAYLGENRLSSVNQAEAEKFSREVFAPMLEEVSKLAPTADERAKLIDYLFAKHGLERNEVMARRAAAKEARKEFEKELRTAARAVSKDPLDQDAEDALDDVKQRMQEREDALYSENRQKTDYAGLTTLTGKAAVADAELMAHDMVDTYENAHDTNALWDAINTVTQRTLKKSFDTGMISRDTYDDIRSMYQFYIPLRGFDERTSNEEYAYLGGTESVFTSPIKTAKGRRSKADDPLAYMQMMAESAIAQGNRNQLVKQKLLNFALNHPSDLISVSELWLRRDPVTDQWSVVQPGDLPGTDKLEDSDTAEMVSQKMEQFEQVMQQLALQNPDDFVRQKDRPDIPYRVVNAREMQQHQVMVKRNGKTYVLTINGNPRAAQAVNGLTNPNNDMSGAIGVMARSVESANRWLSSVYTTRNPDFVLTNLARDAGYTNTMVWLKEDSSYAVNFNRNYATRANLVNMIRLYSRLMKGQLDLTDPTEMLFSQFISNGGETGYTAMRDLDAHKTKIKKELKKLSSDPSVRKVWNASFDMLDLFNKAAENSARFAAFITSREAGRTLDRSIYDAKEISVNFNKKGAGAKFLDSYGAQVKNDIRDLSWKNPNLLKLTKDVAIYLTVFSSGVGRSFFAFWNAAIQGSTNFGRVVKRHPKKALTAMAIMFALGLANAMVGASGDDDDDAEEGNGYFDHPSNTRRSNLMLRINGKSWASIPLPVEYRAVYGMGELLGSVMSGKERYTNQELAHEVLCQVSQVLPLDVVGEGSGAFVPTFAKPAFEVLTNESWTGIPIYKQTVYNERDPAYTKAYSNTNKQLVGMSKMLNELSGGDSQKSGWLDVNPSVIEHLGRGYLGGYFNLVDKLVKTGETVVGSREYDPSNLLIVNRFVKSGSERTAYRAINNRYYQIKADSEELIKDYKGYNYETETGKRDYSQKIAQMKDSPELLSAMAAHEYITEVDKYNKALKSEQDEVLKKRMEKELYELKSAMIHTVDSILDQKQTLRKAE